LVVPSSHATTTRPLSPSASCACAGREKPVVPIGSGVEKVRAPSSEYAW
jgi:hypothetical protein